jgi:hypothetical protein
VPPYSFSSTEQRGAISLKRKAAVAYTGFSASTDERLKDRKRTGTKKTANFLISTGPPLAPAGQRVMSSQTECSSFGNFDWTMYLLTLLFGNLFYL